MLTALTLTIDGDGTAFGAVYIPVELMVPTVELPPAMPFTFQVTVVTDALRTVALNCSLLPVLMVAAVGEMVTVTVGGGGGLVMVTDALPTADVVALLVA